MRSIVVAATVAALAATAAACGGGDATPTATPPAATATLSVTAAATDPATTPLPSPTIASLDTPTEFESARDAFAARLDSIGANIGFVPDDVRDDLLAQCRALSAFADDGEVDQLCDGVAQAIEDGDPGRVDLVLQGLSELTED